jgi:nucleoside-diphosphate-sugar epimerase
MKNKKIILPGGAGLVGQNLIPKLKEQGFVNIVVIDKHQHNLAALAELHSDVKTVYADLTEAGEWQDEFEDAYAVVILQAQIGGKYYDEFVANNVEATKYIVQLIQQYNIQKVVHISSSVVNSVADDFYTRSKIAQEQFILDSGIDCPILRPTLMFGWFDRKHLGWLSRFMNKVPIFPIPGNGKYMRQPLYVGDFCNIIVSCIINDIKADVYDITGLEKIDYIDIIREIKTAIGSNTPIVKIPFKAFAALLAVWALFDKSPPFTLQQLEALRAPDEFEVIDWPRIFDVGPSKFSDALNETFNHPVFSKIEMEF